MSAVQEVRVNLSNRAPDTSKKLTVVPALPHSIQNEIRFWPEKHFHRGLEVPTIYLHNVMCMIYNPTPCKVKYSPLLPGPVAPCMTCCNGVSPRQELRANLSKKGTDRKTFRHTTPFNSPQS